MIILQAKNNAQFNLSKRLATTAAAVRWGGVVADVGCDHGKLPAFLCVTERVQKAYAIDISAPSLEKARRLFDELEIKNAETILCDGLPEQCRDATDIVIAGIGADVIIDIIERAPWLKSSLIRLVLVPSSQHARLRRYLAQNGFVTEDETAISESGQCYAVMTVSFDGVSRTLQNGEDEMGLIRPVNLDSYAYVRHTLNKLTVALAGQRSASSPDTDMIKYLEECIAYIERTKK